MIFENFIGIILMLLGATAFGHSQEINKVKSTNFNAFLALATIVGLVVGSLLLAS